MATLNYTYFANCNDYWKLETYEKFSFQEMKEMLTRRGYHFGSLKSKGDLQQCLQRADRGLLSYINLSNNELRELIHARGIVTYFGPGNIGQRNELTQALENSDRNLRFHRFGDLPPELRNEIYGYYYADFKDKPLHAPKQPPLTLTCRWIREEALPLFYKSCIFAFSLTRNMKGPWPPGWANSAAVRLQIPLETSMWMHHTKHENMAKIQRLCVKIDRLDSQHFSWWEPWSHNGQRFIHVDLTKGSGTRIKLDPDDGNHINRRFKKYLLRKLAFLFNQVVPGPGGGRKLGPEIFFSLRSKLETAGFWHD